LLHQLGDARIADASKNVIVTKTSDGGLAIAAWNLVDPDQQGTTKQMELDFRNIPATARVTIQKVDRDHGNVLPHYATMGKPLDPTPEQVEELNRQTTLPPPETVKLQGNRLDLSLTPDELVLVKVQP
jgi:xylan 1,4-beta-xylosidase